jgi:N-acetylmuramoyl-L-alanine amidase
VRRAAPVCLQLLLLLAPPVPALAGPPQEPIPATAAATAPSPQPPAAATPQETVPFERPRAAGVASGAALTVDPAAVTDAGPLFALAPLVGRLGGELRPGEGGGGYLLVVGEGEALFGPGSDALVLGGEVRRLSQPPVAADSGLQVPLDLLRLTWGDFAGYRFTWDPAARRLTVERGAERALSVELDLVHIQGLTTVVLQFPEAPRYRIVEAPERVEVQLLGDRLESVSRGEGREDPLVRDIRFESDRILLDLAAGAAADSYTLEKPFRLVFDVHRAAPPPAGPGRPIPTGPPPEIEGIRTIVIDPGHGGGNVGATGPSGVHEKDLTLILAQALKAELERRLPVRVILTRNEDASLPLETRTAIANQNKADLFVSLHLNSVAGPGGRAHGAETYFLSMQASDARAARSAERENQGADDGGGAPADGDLGDAGDALHDLQLILWDLAQSHHLAESQSVAKLIQQELNGALELRDRGVKQAPFVVLMGAAMPAVLVELGFLSNPDEERQLQDAGYRAELVAALVRAISRYKAQVDVRADFPGDPGPAAGPDEGAGG